MNRIKSFTINHNLLMPGFYISREDGDVITYDLRTRKRLYGQCNHAFSGAYVCYLYSQFQDGK